MTLPETQNVVELNSWLLEGEPAEMPLTREAKEMVWKLKGNLNRKKVDTLKTIYIDLQDAESGRECFPFPPIVVGELIGWKHLNDNALAPNEPHRIIIDGYHRVEAMQEAGRDTIPAVVIPIHTEQELIYETLRHMKPFTVSHKRR